MKKEKPQLTFRKATPKDADVYLELEKTAIGQKTYSGIKDKEEALQEFSENEVYLIYKDGGLVGSTEFEMKSPDHAYLAGVVIHPNFQGQGIAREATLFRLEKLKNVKRVDVVTHPENFKIINLYQSLGFKIEKRIENYFGDGEPRVMIVRTLK
ncbi:MAG: N-acetyltransferase [Patescibacteria group bacterium]